MSPQRLQELHLQHNSIEMLAEQALVGLSSLALLDLSRNNLHTIGPATLRPLVSLQVLRITGEHNTQEQQIHVFFFDNDIWTAFYCFILFRLAQPLVFFIYIYSFG